MAHVAPQKLENVKGLVLTFERSPAFTRSLSFLITTLPRSIAAGTPAFWRSPTIGPGLNGVSPSRTQMSSGERSPPRAGAFVFVASISLNKRKGLISAVTTAV